MTATTVDREAPDLTLAQRQAAGLRALADLIEKSPDLAHDLGYALARIDNPLLSKEALANFARGAAAAGVKVEKQLDGDYYEVVVRFGPVVVKAWVDRDVVCERVVTGTTTVTKTVKDPEALAAVPEVEVTEEVETFEWVCRPLLEAGADR